MSTKNQMILMKMHNLFQEMHRRRRSMYPIRHPYIVM